MLFDTWPPMDIYETGDTYIIICEIAGMKENDFQVSVSESDLTIGGERIEDPLKRQASFHCYEIGYGPFERKFFVPNGNSERIEAIYQNGFLKLVIPIEIDGSQGGESDMPDFYRNLRNMQDHLNVLFTELGIETGWEPPATMYETEDFIDIICEIAGMEERDFNITFEKNRLAISGERTLAPQERKVIYHCLELHDGSFRRSFPIRGSVHVDGIEATYKNGFLKVRLPKVTKSRNIPVE